MTHLTLDSLPFLGRQLASPDGPTRRQAADTILADPGCCERLDDATLLLVAGVRTLDAETTIEAATRGDPAAVRAAGLTELAQLPPPVQARLATQWGLAHRFAAATGSGQTYALTARILEVGGLRTGAALVERDLARYPAGGGGARAAVTALRRLNGTVADQLDLRLHAALADHDEAVPAKVLRGTFLVEADLFGLAERLGARGAAEASAAERTLLANARAAFVLDRAEILADLHAADACRALLLDAWATCPDPGTLNVARRLARYTGHPGDRGAVEAMQKILTDWGIPT